MRLRALSCAIAVAAVCAPAPALGAWSSPAWVSARDGAAYSQPDTAVADAGRALTAFVRTPAGSAAGAARVQVATRPSVAGRWSAPVVLSARGARAPRVAINDRGDAVVVWVSGRRLVAAARRGPVGKWSAAGAIEAGGPVQDLRLAIDRVGRPALVWSERRGEDFLVRTASRASPKVAWTIRAARISTQGPTPPSLAISRAAAMVAWIDGSKARASRTVGGMFEPAIEVSSQGTGSPGVALTPLGGMLASWSVDLPGRDVGGAGVRALRPLARLGRLGGRGHRRGPARRDQRARRRRRRLGPGRPGFAAGHRGQHAPRRRPSGQASTVVARRTCDCALTVGDVAVDASGTALVGWRREDGDGIGSGGASAHGPGADEWTRAPVTPGRTPAAPIVAGGVRGGLVAWGEAGSGGGIRVTALRP